MGGKNMSLWKEIDITVEKPFFLTPTGKTFIFADVPHLIKLIRNHFIDKGFKISSNITINCSPVQELLDLQQRDLKIAHKINQQHLEVVTFSNTEDASESLEDDHISGQLLRPISKIISLDAPEQFSLSQFEDISTEIQNRSDVTELEDDAIEYLAGYLIKKLKINKHVSEDSSYTWVDQISEGGLKKPSREFQNKIKSLENIFFKHNKNDIYTGSKFLAKLLNDSENVDLNIEVKKLYYRTRLYIRIRYLNNDKSNICNNTRKKRKLLKTIT